MQLRALNDIFQSHGRVSMMLEQIWSNVQKYIASGKDRHWARQHTGQRLSTITGNTAKPVAGYSLPRSIACLTQTKFRERPTRIGRQTSPKFKQSVKMSLKMTSKNLTPHTSMKNQTHDFEDLVKSRIRGRTSLTSLSGELGTWWAQVIYLATGL